jgi:hypothetical protein
MAFESGFNSTGPHRINPESVIFAYKNSGIIMKDDTRCCLLVDILKNMVAFKNQSFLKFPKN